MYTLGEFDPLVLDHVVACKASPDEQELAAVMSQVCSSFLTYLPDGQMADSAQFVVHRRQRQLASYAQGYSLRQLHANSLSFNYSGWYSSSKSFTPRCKNPLMVFRIWSLRLPAAETRNKSLQYKTRLPITKAVTEVLAFVRQHLGTGIFSSWLVHLLFLDLLVVVTNLHK
jgi:hypothetical protein